MKKAYVLDACALLAFLNNEEGADVVEGLLRAATGKKCSVFMARLNLLEVYYGLRREAGEAVADKALELMGRLPIKLVDGMPEATFREAGRLKALYRISLADAVAVAEARVRKAELVTADRHELESVLVAEKIAPCWIR